MNGKILVVGSLNMDLVVKAPRHPQIGETILGGTFATFPGGKGANQAVAAARMGAHVQMIGCVGADGFGTELVQAAARDGIDTRLVRTDPAEATGIALITVDGEGRNTIVVASGANLALTPAHLREAEAVFGTADVLVVQLESPLDTVGAAIDLAAAHHMQVVLNPAPAQPLPPALLAKVDVFIPNEREAQQVAGADTLDEAVTKLMAMGVKNLIVTLGEAGALVVTAQGRTQIPAYRVTAVDTVAAGDAFVGAFATGLAEGLSLEASARLGNAAAALSVTRAGAQPSLPTRDEVVQFLGDRK